MSAGSSTEQQENKRNVPIPPRRGQIKSRIFQSLKKTVVSALSGNRGNGTGSAAGTPPSSSYNSDASAENA